MKRKDFLKITALGVGAFGAGSLLTNAALSDSPQKVETPLETEGWLQEPPRQLCIPLRHPEEKDKMVITRGREAERDSTKR